MADLDKLTDEVKGAIVKQGVKRALGGDSDPETKSKLEKLKGWLILGGSAVGLVVFISLFMGLLRWLFGVAVLGGLGYGGYLIVRPKIRALRAAAQEKKERLLVAKREEDAVRAKEQAVVAKKQALEDELLALKSKVEKDG